MRFLGIVGILLVVYGIYLAVGMALVKPAFEQFHHGIEELNDEIQRFDEGQ